MRLFIKLKECSDKDAEYLERNGYPVNNGWVDITPLFDVFNPSDLGIVHEAIDIDTPITKYIITK